MNDTLAYQFPGTITYTLHVQWGLTDNYTDTDGDVTS